MSEGDQYVFCSECKHLNTKKMECDRYEEKDPVYGASYKMSAALQRSNLGSCGYSALGFERK